MTGKWELGKIKWEREPTLASDWRNFTSYHTTSTPCGFGKSPKFITLRQPPGEKIWYINNHLPSPCYYSSPLLPAHLLISPSLAHRHSLLPSPKPLLPVLLANLRLESLHTGSIHVLELVEGLPDADGEAGCDGSAEGGGFQHAGALDGDANQVCLCLSDVLASFKRGAEWEGDKLGMMKARSGNMKGNKPACKDPSSSFRHRRPVQQAVSRYPWP